MVRRHSSPARLSGGNRGVVGGLRDSVADLVSLCARLASLKQLRLRMKASTGKKNRAAGGISQKRNHEAAATTEQQQQQQPGEGYGDGGVWQRAILMGDKCQPLEFSGVIYYDSHGKQLSELPPRSPRPTASPLPAYALAGLN